MNRGQAALEFLATYGWALLAMSLALSALSYFGVLNPSAYLPERCSFPSDISCEDYMMTGDGASNLYNVSLQLRHNFGETVILHNVTCYYPHNNGTATWQNSGNKEWKPKETAVIDCQPTGPLSSSDNYLISGEKEKVRIELTYAFGSSGYDHYIEGTVFSTAR